MIDTQVNEAGHRLKVARLGQYKQQLKHRFYEQFEHLRVGFHAVKIKFDLSENVKCFFSMFFFSHDEGHKLKNVSLIPHF